MKKKTSQTKSKFVAVASIAAELSEVMDVAKEISLAAANAKAIAFRAGEKARGFQPITDFINELAKETIEKVNRINEHAMLLYQLTVEEYRTTDAFNKFEEVIRLAQGSANESSLKASSDLVQQRMHDCRKRFQVNIDQLLDQLQEVMHPARAARVIAANSRIEASQAGEYLQSLQAVAESVDHAAQIIHDNVQGCRSALIVINFSEK
ncbi:MAG: chemotaxis protein [Methylicorpusculum sp.]|uniref:chemotaxis protein n=1 Tax=Methylicorpusculum sp. TaxID=2713644 RepID=UPI002718192D|nr:chemotaxis protein [Methylicorpusculum sp.]MDO8845160.1 chemotaxis protein [Methylicorpusculum sp.]MDO8938884.1 chemotaxis protein [Methylicorpusculum sp.]MDP2202894.1 chemotaxis protein [Methylicorpusculum sp.]